MSELRYKVYIENIGVRSWCAPDEEWIGRVYDNWLWVASASWRGKPTEEQIRGYLAQYVPLEIQWHE